MAQSQSDRAPRLVNPEEVVAWPMYLRFRGRPERTCLLGLDTMESFVSTSQFERHV